MSLLQVFQFNTVDNFYSNLDEIVYQYENSEDALIALFPEVALTGFAYHRMAECENIAEVATKKFKEITLNNTKALVITMIEKSHGDYVNVAKVFFAGEVIYTQKKHKLFILGQEKVHFKAGEKEGIKIFEINGVKCAMLICFELRFPDLWKQIEGAELILIPAMWGVGRAKHLVILSTALAITNRAYVALSNSSNKEYAKESAIISPWGDRIFDNDEELIEIEYDPKEIKFIKRAIPYD